MTLVVKAAMPGGHCGLSGDPLHEIGIAVPFQPDEGVLALTTGELVTCVTVGVPDTVEVMVPRPVVVDVENVAEPKAGPLANEEPPDVIEADTELGPVTDDAEMKLETNELEADEIPKVLLLLDDDEVDVRLSDDVVLTKTGGVGIDGAFGFVVVVVVVIEGAEVLRGTDEGAADVGVDKDALELERTIVAVEIKDDGVTVLVGDDTEPLGTTLVITGDDRLAEGVDGEVNTERLALGAMLLGPLEDPAEVGKRAVLGLTVDNPVLDSVESDVSGLEGASGTDGDGRVGRALGDWLSESELDWAPVLDCTVVCGGRPSEAVGKELGEIVG
jgi:hypothetical protein